MSNLVLDKAFTIKVLYNAFALYKEFRVETLELILLQLMN
jgi:hypothetical protein